MSTGATRTLVRVRVKLLGPLEVEGPDGEVTISAAKERSLLGALALTPGSVVSTESLVRALWGDEPPAAARKTLQTYVWHLRQLLGDDAIGTQPTGYALCVAPDAVDVVRFRTLVRQGDRSMAEGAIDEARATLSKATALWRGDPFPGVAAHTGLATEAIRLREEHLSALEARIAAELAGGAHAEVVADLEAMVREHPFRERLWGHLMVALYRCGRQSDALAAYQRARELLVTELGLEPGGELRRLEAAVLQQDPAIAAPRASVGPARPVVPVDGAILRSPVRYATSRDGVSIAYRTAGDGPFGIFVVPGFVSHLDIWWDAPTDQLVRRLTSIGRLISFDKRGMGLSDRPERVDRASWVDDALAVLDAAGSDRPVVVLGVSAGGATAIELAVAHPERVAALVLHGAYARHLAADDYPMGHSREIVSSFAENMERRWGSGVGISTYAPSRAEDPEARAHWARYQLLSASPSAAMRFFWATVDVDVRHLLPHVSVPTLVIHPKRDVATPVGQAEYLAERIPGAKLVTLDSDVHLLCLSDVLGETGDAIERFLGEAVRRRAPDSGAPAEGEDGMLRTVVAVRLAPSGDRDRAGVVDVVDRHGGLVQQPLVATFAGPRAALRAIRELAAGFSDPDLAIAVDCGECVAVAGEAGSAYRGSTIDRAVGLAEAAGRRELVLTAVAAALLGEDLGVDGLTVRSVSANAVPT